MGWPRRVEGRCRGEDDLDQRRAIAIISNHEDIFNKYFFLGIPSTGSMQCSKERSRWRPKAWRNPRVDPAISEVSRESIIMKPIA